MKLWRPSVIATVIVSLTLALGLAACGGEEPAPTATTAPVAPEATATKAAPTPTGPSSTEAPTVAMTDPTPVPTVMAEPAPTATPETAMPVPDITADPAPTAMTEPATPVPAVTMAPAPTAMPGPTATPAAPSEAGMLAQYAAEHAGGPGAIFVGDPMQIIGPPPHEGLMFRVPEELYTQGSMAALFGAPDLGIPGHMFIYTSDYYQGLIQKANLTNPTELTSSGESIEIQHTCIDRNLPTCVLIQAYWAPNLAKRTNGQVKLSVVSFIELGLTGADTLEQVSNGTLDMVNIYTGYVAGALPALEIQSLWGMSPGWETTYQVLTGLAPDIDGIIRDATRGSQVLNRNWFAGSDQWFFGNQPLVTLEDFQGLKIRSHSAAMSDFIKGMGSESVFLGPAEIYPALERGLVDAVATALLLAAPNRLFEVADFMAGPVIAFGYTNNVVNKDVWDDIPADLQQIIIEEGAKAELEGLRLAPFQNVVAVQINQQLGVQPVPFSEDIVRHIQTVVLPEHVIPGWLRRLGYPGKGQESVALFNEKVGPYIGLKVAEDGSVKQAPITKGSRAEQ